MKRFWLLIALQSFSLAMIMHEPEMQLRKFRVAIGENTFYNHDATLYTDFGSVTSIVYDFFIRLIADANLSLNKDDLGRIEYCKAEQTVNDINENLSAASNITQRIEDNSSTRRDDASNDDSAAPPSYDTLEFVNANGPPKYNSIFPVNRTEEINEFKRLDDDFVEHLLVYHDNQLHVRYLKIALVVGCIVLNSTLGALVYQISSDSSVLTILSILTLCLSVCFISAVFIS